MGRSRMASLAVLFGAGAIAMPLLVSSVSSVAASPRTKVPIGRQLAELSGSDTIAGDYFGYAVAISGATAVVGGSNGKGGRAYVFAKTGTGWHQVAELKGSDTVQYDGFDSSVAISGTTFVVGAPEHAKSVGRAYVFAKTAAGWHQVAELKGSGAVAGELFGSSVAISGSTIVVGANGYAPDGVGRAYVFTKTATGWHQVAVLKGSGRVASELFGTSVALSGGTIVVGANGYGVAAGRAYVFTKRAGAWKQAAMLKGSDTVAPNYFGVSVAISGTTVVVGAPEHAPNSAGRAYVFAEEAGHWKQTAELKGYDTVARDSFGGSVAISGTTIISSSEYHGLDGRAYLFTKEATGWKEIAEIKGSDDVAGDTFGASIAISGTTAVVGNPQHAQYAGRVYVFEA
jgi:hypothetical protein